MLRVDFRLSYAAVGVLLTAPSLFGAVIQPVFGLLADAGRRRLIVLSGGVAFAAALVLAALARNLPMLLLAFLLLDPASGAFVSLSQASLMDLDPERHEHNMARWTAAGSLGALIGPVVLVLALAFGLDWRPVFLGLAVLALPLIAASRANAHPEQEEQSFRDAVRGALAALRRIAVLRWLVLLQSVDLLGDVFLGFLALYLVDAAHLRPIEAALGVTVWSAAGLTGDLLLIWVLARVEGLSYLRVSAALMLLLFPAFLFTSSVPAKLVLVALIGLVHTGWYAIPKGRLFSELPGGSGVASALDDLSSFIGRLSPLLIGLLAQRFGIAMAMWLLLLAPLSLLLGLP